jgi:peptidoglycan hydrolase CwlO-like protein
MEEVSLTSAVIVAVAGGGGVVIAKVIDMFMSRSVQSSNREQVMYTRQKELDVIKDNLIGVFQTQISDLRLQIDSLIEKNTKLHEENISLRYEKADLALKVQSLERQLGVRHASS